MSIWCPLFLLNPFHLSIKSQQKQSYLLHHFLLTIISLTLSKTNYECTWIVLLVNSFYIVLHFEEVPHYDFLILILRLFQELPTLLIDEFLQTLPYFLLPPPYLDQRLEKVMFSSDPILDSSNFLNLLPLLFMLLLQPCKRSMPKLDKSIGISYLLLRILLLSCQSRIYHLNTLIIRM